MENDKRELHKKILVNLAIGAGVLLFVIFLLPKILRFFAPLIIAWIVALIATPPIRFLEKHINIGKKHGTAIIIVLVLVAICAAFYGVAALAVMQLSNLVHELPGIYTNVMQNLQEAFYSLHQRWHVIPENLQSLLNTKETAANDYIMTALNGLQSGTFSKVGNVASSVIDFIVYLILTILACYFMTVEKDHISENVRRRTPDSVLRFWNKVKNICMTAIGGYFKAHFQIMIVIFFITVIPFIIMGVPYSGLLAVIIAFVDFLPFFGAGTVLGPWAIYELLTGSYRYGIILIVLYFVIMIVRQILEPKLVGDSIGMNPFELLIYMLIGYRIGGMLGLILAIPAGMIIMACYREGMFDSYIRGIKILVQDINSYRKY